MKQKLILASTSPRRHGLLQQIGLECDVMPSRYEEDMGLRLKPSRLAMTLAKGKALDVAKRVKKGVVIGVDTFLVLGRKKIGKPKDKDDAKRILRMISNKTLKVYSGVAIIDAETMRELVDYEVTKIKMRRLSELDIKHYISTKEPLDKAGAIAIQGMGAIFISEIKGCYSNVIGLPLHKIAQNLAKFGVDIFAYEKWTNYLDE
jgi:septum formation protein